MRFAPAVAVLLLVISGCATPPLTDTGAENPPSSPEPPIQDRWEIDTTDPAQPGLRLEATIERTPDGYHAVATVFNEGEQSYEYALHCQPRGIWSERVIGVHGIDRSWSRAPCVHIDGRDDTIPDRFAPGESTTYETWFNGSVPHHNWPANIHLPPGPYAWGVSFGRLNATIQVALEGTASASQDDITLDAGLYDCPTGLCLAAMARNEGNVTFQIRDPGCGTVGLLDYAWFAENETVAFARDNCPPSNGWYAFAPGDVVAFDVAWPDLGHVDRYWEARFVYYYLGEAAGGDRRAMSTVFWAPAA